MLLELLALDCFNGNSLAEELGVHFKVLSRRKKDGAFTRANFIAVRRLHELHVLGKADGVIASDETYNRIVDAAVARYRDALREQITLKFGNKFKAATISRIHRIIDGTKIPKAEQHDA